MVLGMQPAVTALKWILIQQVTMVYPVQHGVRNQRDKQDDDDDDDDDDRTSEICLHLKAFVFHLFKKHIRVSI